MKKQISILFVPVLIFLLAFTNNNPPNWKIKEDGYSIKFSSKKINGIFTGLKAIIVFDSKNLSQSKITALIDVPSANTGNNLKNKHVLHALEACKFQTIKFESTSISKKGNSFEAYGKLTMKGVTKEIILPFSFAKNENDGVFSGSFSVIPKEYSIDKSGTPDVIEISLYIKVSKL